MLMPSEMESFGLAALEAMACSVPSIATRVGGVPELIDDGDQRPALPAGRRGGHGRRRHRLCCATSPRLHAMAAAARKTASDRFCSTRIIPLYEQYYERVLARSAELQPQA